ASLSAASGNCGDPVLLRKLAKESAGWDSCLGTQLFCGGPNGTLGGRGGSSCSGVSPSMITAIVIMALYSVVCVVGLFGNFLVMYVIIR
uniref:Uncharacterized protein n=1 Tax=Naja naja TaxID=35670 RepID=A0A8C6V3V2_NAJNA